MTWVQRLAERREKIQKPPSCELTKLPKPPFVSFGSEQDRHFSIFRADLIRMAEVEGIDPGLIHRLPEAELQAHAAHVESFPTDQHQEVIRALLSMLADDADRQAGRVPKGDTTAILCRKCGPVFVHPTIASMLPVVGGWPRALGCLWCFVRLAEGLRVPRPRVTCAACLHYQPDAINPDTGMGRCGIDANQGGTTWPQLERVCKAFKPRADT